MSLCVDVSVSVCVFLCVEVSVMCCDSVYLCVLDVIGVMMYVMMCMCDVLIGISVCVCV